MSKKYLLQLVTGVSFAALIVPAAFAQTGTPKAQNTQDEPEVIIVTAQKRNERLQDVPLTVSVVSSAALARQSITNLTDLQNATPELNFVGQPSSGFSIRGSGTQSFARSAENNVLLVVDGVVHGQLTPSTNSLFDVAQVEVLSGPQGMLFGKNASAGVINVTTASPNPADQSGFLRLSAGEDGYRVFNGTFNQPLGEKAAIRVNVAHDAKQGMLLNRFNGRRIDDRDASGARVRILWDASEALTFNLIADFERQNGGNNAWQARAVNNTGSTSIAGRSAACGVVPSPTNTEVCLDGDTSQSVEIGGLSAQADWTVGGYVVTGILGYREYRREASTDSDTRPINALNLNTVSDDVQQSSQELRIASSAQERFSFVVGLFNYDHQYFSVNQQAGTLGLLPFVAARTTTDDVSQTSFAVFGQGSFKVTPQFNIIFGGRQTWDKVSNTVRSFVNPALGVRFVGFSPAVDSTASPSVDTENFSWRLGAQYQPSDNLTFFATYSKGYKGPAVNNTLASSAAPAIVREEIPTNIEVGFKGGFFDNRLRADVSIFEMVSKDFQTQTALIVNGLTQFVFANASELTFQGIQANLTLRPARGLNFTLGTLYNEATYGDFRVVCNAPFLDGCTTSQGATTISAKGRQLAGAPKTKVTFGASYERSIGNNMLAFADGNLAYRSDINTSATPDPNLVIGAYTLIDGRIGIKTEDGRISLAVFGKNLGDERAAGFIFRDPLSPTGNYMQSFASNAFRTIGVTLEARF